jgi:hypothetical protein
MNAGEHSLHSVDSVSVNSVLRGVGETAHGDRGRHLWTWLRFNRISAGGIMR